MMVPCMNVKVFENTYDMIRKSRWGLNMQGQGAWDITEGIAGRDVVRKSYEAHGPQQTEQQNGKSAKKVWHKRCFVVQLNSGSTGLC